MNVLEKLYEEYQKEYEFIYQVQAAGNEVPGLDEAVKFFVKVAMVKYLDLLSEFNGYTDDLITSDREAAAYVFACDNLGLLN